MIALIIFIAILSIMILAHEAGHFYQARRLGIRVERFALGFGPQLLTYKKGETEYALCLFAFGGYIKMAGDSWQACNGRPDEFLARRPFERAQVIFAGPVLNYVLAFLCFWLVNIVGYPMLTTKVGELMAGYPAKSSGLLKGDVITAIDGREVRYWQELQEALRKKKAPAVELDILRNTRKIKLSVSLRQEEAVNLLGAREKINLIGIRAQGESVLVRHGILKAFFKAGKNLGEVTAVTYMALGRILTGALSIRESVTGPLGMFYITSQAVSLGVSAVLHLMAVLSASLAIFNLLPLPVLDGGHILFLGIESLRGRHLSEEVEEKITQAGMAFIICLAVFIFLNDLVRFGVWEKIGSVVTKIIR